MLFDVGEMYRSHDFQVGFIIHPIGLSDIPPIPFMHLKYGNVSSLKWTHAMPLFLFYLSLLIF